MTNNLLRRISRIGCAVLLVSLCALAQEHRWAGRTVNNLEWSIHQKLAVLPLKGVFDTLNFEVKGKTVTLSGQVVNERVKQNAEHVVGRLPGVESVVNQIEVLPSSRRDQTLRVNMYRAIYQAQTLEKYVRLPPWLTQTVKTQLTVR
jgi:hyperosmotically inducible protein